MTRLSLFIESFLMPLRTSVIKHGWYTSQNVDQITKSEHTLEDIEGMQNATIITLLLHQIHEFVQLL